MVTLIAIIDGGTKMHAHIGDQVTHPESRKQGRIIEILKNPACLLRTLVITWETGETEELSELEFGPLDDDD